MREQAVYAIRSSSWLLKVSGVLAVNSCVHSSYRSHIGRRLRLARLIGGISRQHYDRRALRDRGLEGAAVTNPLARCHLNIAVGFLRACCRALLPDEPNAYRPMVNAMMVAPQQVQPAASCKLGAELWTLVTELGRDGIGNG